MLWETISHVGKISGRMRKIHGLGLTYHVAIPAGQAFASEVDRKQAARTGRIEIAARAGEAEEPAQPVREHGALAPNAAMARSRLGVFQRQQLPVVGKGASKDGGVGPG